jgi:C4-dicarboxylate-specific signal transduction histidine kinase
MNANKEARALNAMRDLLAMNPRATQDELIAAGAMAIGGDISGARAAYNRNIKTTDAI